jgi:hypothetical protein
MISNWHHDTLKGFGKKIQAGILGKVYAKLKLLNQKFSDKYIMLPKSAKTTKTCMNAVCGKINNINLSDRVYTCSCGYKNDRDNHSAYSMILIGNKLNNNILNNINLNVRQEFGRNSDNLVKSLASIGKIENLFSIITDKLCSKSYIKATQSSFV